MNKTRGFKLKSKILVPTAILFFLLLSVIIFFSIMRFNNFAQNLMDARIEAAANGIRDIVDEKRRATIDIGLQLAADQRIIQGIINEDRPALLAAANELIVAHNLVFSTIMNQDAVALVRTQDPDNWGDILPTPSLRLAAQGIVSVAYGPMFAWQSTIRSSVPIIHEGEIIGALIAAMALDTDYVVDNLAEIYGAEVVVFVGDEAMASTLLNPDGSRAVGNHLDSPEVVDQVLNRQQEMFATVDIRGEVFSAFYLPLHNSYGDVIATLFIGLSNDGIIAERNTLIWQVALVGVLGVALTIVVLFVLLQRVIRPIHNLKNAAGQISQGNLAVNFDTASSDEIGELANSFQTMQKEIVALIAEIQKRSNSIVKGNLLKDGDGFLAKGDFQEILEGVDDIANSIVQYFDDMPCGIVLFDNEYHFTFINAFNRKQGFDPKTMLGTTIRQSMPEDEAEELMAHFKKAAATGERVSYLMEMNLPDGNIVYENHAIMPIKDSKGKITAYLHFSYDNTEIAQSKRRSDKINAYQDFEAGDITRHLTEGLSQGLLQFTFVPEPHDDDTAAAAAAFKQIGDELKSAVDFIKGYMAEISSVLQEFSNNNFDVRVEQDYIGDFSTIRSSLHGLMDSMTALISEIQMSTSQVEAGAEQISISTQALMTSLDEKTGSISEVREAVNILTEKTQKNAEDAQLANGLSEKVQKAADEGSQHMKDMSEVMEEIKKSSSDIASVARVIEDIAFQTNLLALNASVEAARAGEHGRGFAVVADEVRTLANRSAAAAKDASEMIAKSLGRVDEGVAKSAQTAEALKNIVQSTSSVSGVIAGIAGASGEQAEEITRIQNSMEVIYRGTTENSDAVQSNASVCEELSAQAGMLMNLVDKFKIGRR
ncbi:MAG: methyl-accepting chemotaxis protein [Clostridiales bacterium]|nr:methyl-accepting chemotaxis protein [Clostridiales bacterium]